ncbi:penicillin acylase family protein [Chryseolinea lacunae]|uniref:Penicillin acylase family protein n=1 Tax=Chryseolinea lacunae TaxID=2801331 RepID=A0ABS1KX44_9BACT|nr:penicillin acylase family protein [Chryseolinea lacunae]MBL0744048.1 penicillin acylase family protein [Chryseolinea lacunae]
MRLYKFVASLAITLALVYGLDHRWEVGGSPIPPLGRFLDPFQGFWHNLEPAAPHREASLSIPGLQAAVTVSFDSLNIPHIFAPDEASLYFAQGYITAQSRLWQMEFQTHAAAGRVSEITGPGPQNAVLDYDRGQRRLGLVFGAVKAQQAFEGNPQTRAMVEQYTAGINAYIQSLHYADLPFEYKLLHYAPEPWSNFKCALLLKSMAQSLNLDDKDMEMTTALKAFGLDNVELLYPDREAVSDPIVDKPGGWKFNPVTLDSVPSALPPELIGIKKLPHADPTTGSNNWAVSGSKTASGAPLLCSDPHLNLSLPSLWYCIQLSAPGVNTLGASLPGAPGVIIGCNDSVAWGETNAQRDLEDWFKITFQDKTHAKYMLDGNWVDTKKVVESFKVRGTEVFYDTVLYTHWGPVTYDETYHPESNQKYYAFRWISHDASNEFLAFYKLNRAHNYADYMAALDHYEAPAQNFVFASTAGDIAMRVQGKYPVRRALEGKFVMDGTRSANGWQAFIPFDQNVMDKNPARGFVSSANQIPADATYPYYITGNSFEAYRNRRINTLLAGMQHVTPADMMKMQTDNFNMPASEGLPYFLKALDSMKLSPTEKKARDLLASWNFINDKTSEGASYFECWFDHLTPMLWDEMTRIAISYPTTYQTLYLLKQNPALPFFDIQGTPEKETAKEVLQKAFVKSVAYVEAWKKEHGSARVDWGDYKDGYVGHIMRVPALGVHVKAGGNHDIINAHSRTHGPSWRMITSLEKSGVKMWGIYPGGQSGNPGSAHFKDMLQPWVDGQYFPIPFLRSSATQDQAISFTTQLNPVQP